MINNKILLVEDDENIREGITEFLTVKGYEVKEARDGEEALLIFDKADFNLADLCQYFGYIKVKFFSCL